MYPPVHEKPLPSFSYDRLDRLWERYPQYHAMSPFSTLDALLEAMEEHQVTGLQVILLDAHAVKDLAPRRAVELDAEALEHVAGKARAVKTAGRHGSVAVRSATETICVIDNLVDEIVAAVLLQLFQNGALLAITQLLGLCSEA